ncbi:MAG: 3-deoxy-7-phosphoheptulonate synthase [Spirochaetota bacterium]
MKETNDLHIAGITPLISPRRLKEEFHMTESSNTTVVESREVIKEILKGQDKRLLGIVGPCSIHDVHAVLDYAQRFKILREKVLDRVYLIMRVYFEKPRTTVGWRGLVVDPYLNGTYDIAAGLRIARKLMLDITGMGIPVGSEVLDPIVPQYIADLLSWASIGARTTESQTHRELASGLSMPVGIKNSTDGSLQTAIDAMESARYPHSFIGIDQEGSTCVLSTRGNPAVHIILRGGKYGPNYYEENVEEAETVFKKLGIKPAIVVDCSHANSGKKQNRQERVLHAIMDQRRRGKDSIVGFMIESFLVEGNQSIPEDLTMLKYGCSVTDECVGWEKTNELVDYANDTMRNGGKT